MKILDGQRALVTGAGSGIGQVMAQHFEKAGARIWICDADTNNLEQSLKENPDWNGTPCDVSDENQVDQLFKEISDFENENYESYRFLKSINIDEKIINIILFLNYNTIEDLIYYNINKKVLELIIKKACEKIADTY